jgi:DNA-binding XRE family transcriptional regulator
MNNRYSLGIMLLNQQAEQNRVGVKLGKKCIKLGIPVAEVAVRVGVSRQTVYNWFIGAYDPKPELATVITQLLRNLK